MGYFVVNADLVLGDVKEVFSVFGDITKVRKVQFNRNCG